jgi:hypothetical protein
LRALVDLVRHRQVASLKAWQQASTHQDLVRWQTAFNEAQNTIEMIEKPQPLPTQR